MKKVICMIGPDKNLNGGISSVINRYSKSYLNEKYTLKIISSYSKYKYYEFIRGIVRYLYFMTKTKIDILHIHTASRGSFFRKSIFMLLTPRRVPIILHIHGGGFLNFYDNSNNFIRLIIKKAIMRSIKIIVISDRFRDSFIERFNLTESKIVKIYNGVEILRKKIDVNNKKNQVLYMGKLTKSKGIYDLLECIPSIHKQCPETVFIIAGNGEIEKVKRIVINKNMDDYVKVVGWIDGYEKEKYLIESKILVMPSHFEAFGISIIEAMQYGLTIVSTNVGGIPEIVADNINGKLVNKGDIKGLAECIVFYINNDDVRVRISKANMIKSLDFDIKGTVYDTDNLYSSIIFNN